jgi:signal transduction histidine kinase
MPRPWDKKAGVDGPLGPWLDLACTFPDLAGSTHAEDGREELLSITGGALGAAERAVQLLEQVQAVSDVALAHLPLDELLPELLRRIRSLLAVDAAAILFVEEGGRTLRVKAAEGLRAASVRIPMGKGFAGRIAAERVPVVIADTASAELLNPVLREAGIRALLGVPLLVDGEVLGVLHVGSREAGHFTQDDVHLVQLLAERVALASHRSRLYEAERQAHAEAEAAVRVRADAERMKNDLTNMIVHDLRNALSGIAMMAQLALRKAGAGVPETQRNYLRQIDRSGREMMRLLLNILEIAKIESGKMPVAHEPIRLATVAGEVAEEYRAVAEQGSRRLVVKIEHGLPPAIGDRSLLKRVLVNLVMNALRHSGGREIRVEATHDPDAARLALQVIDNGRGIPWDDQALVFEKFASIRRGKVRAPSCDTGLGLPFCKLATERMGGEIGLKSQPGHGTVFTVTLPAQSEDRSGNRPESHAGPGNGAGIHAPGSMPQRGRLE